MQPSRANRLTVAVACAVAILWLPLPTWAGEVAVVVEPRLLAASVASALSFGGSPPGPYGAALRPRFDAYDAHPAVRCSRKLRRYGLGANLYLGWALDRELAGDYPDVPSRLVSGCSDALTDFAAVTGVESFGAVYLEAQRARIQQAFDPAWAEVMEAYFGESKANYTVYLAPAQGDASFGGVTEGPLGAEVWAALGPLEFSSSDEAWFSAAVEYFVLHEFAHGFVREDLVSTPAFAGLDVLLTPIATEMAEQGYGNNWENVLIEHLVRGVTCQLMGAKYGEGVGEECVAKEIAGGFRYLPAVVQQLRRYEDNRVQWPTFAAFVHEIAGELQTVRRDGPELWLDRSPYRRMADRLVPVEDWALVVDAGAAESFVGQGVPWSDAAHVHADARSVAPNIPMVVVGNRVTETLLAAYAPELPFRLERDAIEIAGWRIAGEDLALIASMDRPGDRSWMSVYTSNSEDGGLAPIRIDGYLPGWFLVTDASGTFCMAGILPPGATFGPATRSMSCPGRAATLPAIE